MKKTFLSIIIALAAAAVFGFGGKTPSTVTATLIIMEMPLLLFQDLKLMTISYIPFRLKKVLPLQ